MKALPTLKPPTRAVVTGIAATLTLLLLTSCAGGSSDTSDADAANQVDKGYEYGASEAEIQEALSDMEPVTLTYQPAATSAQDPVAPVATEFKEEVERISDGKITIDIVYAQAIVPFLEVPEALADGRLDISMFPPIYLPSEYPEWNTPLIATTQVPASPLVGEIAATAALAEHWASSDEIKEEVASYGLAPLVLPEPTGPIVTICNEKVSEAEDLKGKLVRVSSQAQGDQFSGMGATPLSLPSEEVYEGLQRGTADCAAVPYQSVVMLGLEEVAPHVSYTSEVSLARGPGLIATGSNVADLPLAARQVLFDQAANKFVNGRIADMENLTTATQRIQEAGGSVNELSEDAQQKLEEVNDALVAETQGDAVDTAVVELNESYDKWFNIASDLGFEDKGGFDNVHEWYSREDFDFEGLSDRIFEEIFLDLRPRE